MARRVVITGMGCVSPLGANIQTVWERLTSGQSGVDTISRFDASTFPVRIAAEVRGWSLSDHYAAADRWADHAPQTQFAIGAAVSATESAGLTAGFVQAERIGVYLGCGEIFPELACLADAIHSASASNSFAYDRLQQQYTQYADPNSEVTMDPGVAVSAIAGLVDAQGPSVNFTNACVSSAAAIGEAAEVIRRGDADVMVSGGAHSMIHPMGITAFSRLKTLSLRNDDPTGASRPFERDRDGFVAGEGAAILILEELDHAKRRGAEIWGELTGYGSAHDAYRVTDLRPDAHSATRSMQLAIRDARLSPEAINYINAHGSSTVVNDAVETTAIKQAFADYAHEVAISSTKSMTGHLTTACGALEVLFCVLTVKYGVAPPTINYENPDPACDLDYTPNTARELDCRHVMNNNFGFGGQNVALVISRFDG